MNIAMWAKALQVIPRITKQEWDDLDAVSYTHLTLPTIYSV